MAGTIGSRPKVACPSQSQHLKELGLESSLICLNLEWNSALPDL